MESQKNDTTTDTEEVIDKEESLEEKAQRIYLSEIMRQLLTRDRFKTFFQCNYEVTTSVDEETQEFHVTLMELDPHIAQQKLQKVIEDHSQRMQTGIFTNLDTESLQKFGKKS